MSLYLIYKGNCHENAHVADLVIMLKQNPTTISVVAEDGSSYDHFIQETWAIHAFFDTISLGKKTDAKGF